jgi:hypothetical protein
MDCNGRIVISGSTEEASSMTDKVRGLNPEIIFDHCLIQHEAIVAKTLPGVHKNMLYEVIKINFIKLQRLNSKLFLKN